MIDCATNLDEGNAVVETHLGEEGLLSILLGLLAIVGGNSLSLLVQTSLLLLLGLWTVLVEETEELGGSVLVEGVGELGDSRGNLQALVEDDLLALEADIFGPLDESSEITGRLDVLACVRTDCQYCRSSCIALPLQTRDAPIPKFLGVFSRRGLVVFLVEDFLLKGAAAGFFPVDFLGGY